MPYPARVDVEIFQTQQNPPGNICSVVLMVFFRKGLLIFLIKKTRN